MKVYFIVDMHRYSIVKIHESCKYYCALMGLEQALEFVSNEDEIAVSVGWDLGLGDWGWEQGGERYDRI